MSRKDQELAKLANLTAAVDKQTKRFLLEARRATDAEDIARANAALERALESLTEWALP